MQEPPLVDRLKEWAREIMEECSPLQVRTIISRYRAKAMAPAVDAFSRREFMMRADIRDELLDTLSVTDDVAGFDQQPAIEHRIGRLQRASESKFVGLKRECGPQKLEPGPGRFFEPGPRFWRMLVGMV